MAIRKLTFVCSDMEIKNIYQHSKEEVAEYMNNKKRLQLAQIESESAASVIVKSVTDVWPEHIEIDIFDESGKKVNFSRNGGLHENGN